jgi:hypothetical protein
MKSISSLRPSHFKDQDKNQGNSYFGERNAIIYFRLAMMRASHYEEIVKFRLLNSRIY